MEILVSPTTLSQRATPAFSSTPITLPRLRSNNVKHFPEQQRMYPMGTGPPAQAQLSESQNGQVGTKMFPGPGRQPVHINNSQPNQFTNQGISRVINEPDDYRFLRPTTASEAQQVTEALLLTRLDFLRRTGFEAPFTPNNRSYAEQHHIIQNGTQEVWLLESEPPPRLCMLGSWTGGFDNWHGLKILGKGTLNALFNDFWL